MKKLPIHIVKFRGTKDDFLTEGMGDKKEPKWMTSENIRRNAVRVISEMDLFESYFLHRGQENKTLPILTVVKLQQEATAKSHRKNVRAMFDLKDKRNVIGMVSRDEIIVKIDNTTDLGSMKKNFLK